jgi:signal transduction histidine kinase
MLFIAMFFLVFALFLMIRVFRGYQAVWLGLALLTFACSIIGLVGLVARFSNYSLEGLFDQPTWALDLLKGCSLYDFMRFRLWSAAAFILSVIEFAFAYAGRPKRFPVMVGGFFMLFILGFVWVYDPERLFQFYRHGASLIRFPPYPHWTNWERQLILLDWLALALISFSFAYALWWIARLCFSCTILQKKIQAFFVGIGMMTLCGMFIVLFCLGRGSLLNAHIMATTLLPLGRDYPFFDTRFLRMMPFAAFVVALTVALSIYRYGFLGTWRVGTRDLERQIHTANKAVRMALHSFKNQFLGVQMAMDMTAAHLHPLEGEAVEKAMVQIESAKDICEKALTRLDVLQAQAQRLHANPRPLMMKDLWEDAKRRCVTGMDGVALVETKPAEFAFVWGDKEYLTTVFENILQNALDALAERQGEGYRPTVKMESGREYEWCYLRIIDNGAGIPRANIHRIFHPFFSTKPAKSNWGLGLAYCHRVVRMHHGFINVRSRLGVGTTFEVVLRCCR